MYFSPDILTDISGRKITSASQWESRRKELVDILAREEYGYIPETAGNVTGEIVSTVNDLCAGHAVIEKINISADTEKGRFTFPIQLAVPVTDKKVPLFVFFNFSDSIPHKYFPVEEITDNGFAVAMIYYEDVTTDNGDMSNGLCGMFARPTDGTGYGKISIWALAGSIALDYLLTRDEFDKDNIAVIGHSRLGKTALWCGANDERFRYVISNDSGCGGSAYERTKHDNAETIESMNRVFPYWFCENRKKYAGNMDTAPFDQHFLLAASAPRHVLIGSASGDLWADPLSEQYSCIGASPAFELSGKGFSGDEVPAKAGDNFDGGNIAYHLRHGRHYLSRNDWNIYMNYIKNHI